MSKREHKVGSPEKPLSDLGLLSYRSYWSIVLIDLLKQNKEKEISIDELSAITCFKTEDIITTLRAMDVIKYSKGQYVFSLSTKVLFSFFFLLSFFSFLLWILLNSCLLGFIRNGIILNYEMLLRLYLRIKTF